MRRFSYLISSYVLQAILPYFAFSWLLLSVILFVQQAGQHSDVLFSSAIPSSLIWQLTIALVPSVIAFTCPVAALLGVIIGLSRMQGDSEMTAIRAAGVGNLQILAPVILLGLFLSGFAFAVNLKGVPLAAQIVRRVALQAALYKLESPIEPGVFNSEIEGFTVYVKDGDKIRGTWKNIFIYQREEEGNSATRLITAKEGRIDSSDNDSEIVLSGANVITIDERSNLKVASEHVTDLRLVVKTKRGEIIDKLSNSKQTPEEMGLWELAQYSTQVEGNERIDSQILLQRRLLLSISPLLFALMGAALVAKFNRGGRGFGIFLALVSLISYYLIGLLGEQLARTQTISVLSAFLIPLFTSVFVISWLLLSQRLRIAGRNSLIAWVKSAVSEADKAATVNTLSRKSSYIDLTTGILDLDLIQNLIKNYLLTFGFLTSIYMLFTAFELWKFAGNMENGVMLLATYLVFLIPFIYIEIAPSALMIATLATYIIKSRQNEIVTWTSAGRSVYRLLLPCFVFMIAVGIANFAIQETILSAANRKQDVLRQQIRSGNKSPGKTERTWIAADNRIISFQNASDNVFSRVKNLLIFNFENKDHEITSFTRVDSGKFNRNQLVFITKPEQFIFNEKDIINPESLNQINIAVSDQAGIVFNKPSHLNIRETSKKIEQSGSESDKRTYLISLYKKYSTPFLPFIITLFTAPFALSLSRKGNVVTLGYAVAIWLLFMGVTKTFEQFGSSGYLSPIFSVWGPLMIFTILGIYLISKLRT